MPSTNPISVVIITKNEERVIGNCIQQARQCSDDIVVIDSGSIDQTVAIATKAGARVFYKEWEGFSSNKNFGIQQATYDWVLSLDADEFLDDTLIKNINQLALDRQNIYVVNRLTNYCGDWVKHSGWFPNWNPRLFYKADHQWDEKFVHESLTRVDQKNKISLEGLIEHYSYFSKAQHLEKTKGYAKYRAQEWIRAGKKPWILKKYYGSFWRFIRSYILLLGFLDKKAGWNIAVMDAKMIIWQFEYYDQLSNIKK